MSFSNTLYVFIIYLFDMDIQRFHYFKDRLGLLILPSISNIMQDIHITKGKGNYLTNRLNFSQCVDGCTRNFSHISKTQAFT